MQKLNEKSDLNVISLNYPMVNTVAKSCMGFLIMSFFKKIAVVHVSLKCLFNCFNKPGKHTSGGHLQSSKLSPFLH